MGIFHQHPDGLIFVRDDVIYGDTNANFAVDFATSVPALPAGATERIYTQQGPHTIIGPDGVMGEGPRPWPYADAIIANVTAGKAAQRARLNPPLTPEQIAQQAAAAADTTRRGQFKADADVLDLSNRIKTANNPAQVDTFVTNMTAPQARAALGTIIKYLISRGLN